MASWQRTLEPTIYVTTKISADHMLMAALFLTPAILSQISAMLDKASQASLLLLKTSVNGNLCKIFRLAAGQYSHYSKKLRDEQSIGLKTIPRE